jgi:outer membrane protein OmpA-like peptidoglycan-associated protein
MKNFILFIFAIASVNSFSQKLEPTETQALLTVIVVNDKVKPLEGEKVSFLATKDKKVYSGITKADGKFQLLVPKGDKYKVQYKAVGGNEDYNTLDMPAVEGQIEFEYKLTIVPPKIYTLDNVFFDTGKATLKPESSKELNELAEYMQLKKSMVVEIAGHTDNVGNKDANQKLSEDRANSVRNYLIKKGITAERIVAKGYGDTQPIADNTSDAGKQKNRRTEVRTIKE